MFTYIARIGSTNIPPCRTPRESGGTGGTETGEWCRANRVYIDNFNISQNTECNMHRRIMGGISRVSTVYGTPSKASQRYKSHQHRLHSNGDNYRKQTICSATHIPHGRPRHDIGYENTYNNTVFTWLHVYIRGVVQIQKVVNLIKPHICKG